MLLALLLAVCGDNPAKAEIQPVQDADFPQGRLPDLVRPLKYSLDLSVDPSQPAFSGYVMIDAELARPASTIYLHGRDLTVQNAYAVVAGRWISGEWKQLDSTGVARLQFREALPAGHFSLSVRFAGSFNDRPSGLFRVKVGESWYSWSQFEAIDARAAFPAFDEPGYKTPFSVTLRTPPGLVAVSNAPEVSSDLVGGQQVHRFGETPPLPTYLVAVMAGPFAVVEGQVPPTPQRSRPLPLRIISTRENAGQLQFALDGSKGIVTQLEAYFGEPFPFSKLDQITSPVMPGAMENAGADLYEDSLLVMDRSATPERQRRFGMVVSHELGHQWFGDLVTPAWWDDIWLNESFANWIGYRIGSEWRPDLNIAAGALREGFQAMDTDSLVAGRAVRQPIVASSQIDAAFDSITYGKGGHVIAMIAAFMGDARFQAGVRRYMAAHRLGNATSNEFFAALAEEAGDPRIVPALQGFVEQQGVPLLTFTRAGSGYLVSQGRYAPLGTRPPETLWQVPMCLRRGSQRQCSILATSPAAVAVEGSGPLMPNAGGTGYYRFELPRRDWDALIARAYRLPGGEAQALSDSLIASFRAGRATVPQLAALASKLVHHPDSYASGSALDGLSELLANGMVGGEALPFYKRFVMRLYMPVIDEAGFDPRAGAYAREAPEAAVRRAHAVERLARLGRGTVIDTVLLNSARLYLSGNRDALDPAWFGLALDAYVERATLQESRALMDKALASQDPVFRPAALSALGGSGKEAVARWLLDEFKDERLRPSEQRGLLRDIVLASGTREFGYAWMRDHLDEMLGGGGIFFSSRLPQILNGFCSIERAEVFARDLRPRLKGTPAELELERTIERVRNCGMLSNARRAEVTAAVMKLR